MELMFKIIGTMKVYLQRVLSPWLWSLVVDKLFNRLWSHAFEEQVYADDLTIIIKGKHSCLILAPTQTSLNITYPWRYLPKRRKHCVAWERRYSEVEYLGIFLDQNLTWNTHLQETSKRATKVWWSLFGKTWKGKSKMLQLSQRFAGVGITGPIRTCTSTTMDALLDLIAL